MNSYIKYTYNKWRYFSEEFHEGVEFKDQELINKEIRYNVLERPDLRVSGRELIIPSGFRVEVKKVMRDYEQGFECFAHLLPVEEKKEPKEESTMKNIPETIYLQIDADGETPEDFKELAGVSWADERIHPNDIEYRIVSKEPAHTLDKLIPLSKVKILCERAFHGIIVLPGDTKFFSEWWKSHKQKIDELSVSPSPERGESDETYWAIQDAIQAIKGLDVKEMNFAMYSALGRLKAIKPPKQ